MFPAFPTRRLIRFTAVMLTAALGLGCAQKLPIPAIDPSGDRIFSGTTTLATPSLANCALLNPRGPVGAGVSQPLPAPPFQPPCAAPQLAAGPLVIQPVAAPAPQPPCQTNQPPPLQIQPQPCPPPRGPELKLYPHVIAAPICSDVVLAAGLCGADGRYITGQPLEWMLSPDGVGQIVDVGREAKHNSITSYWSGTPKKLTTNYVKAHTSSVAQRITRGTPTPQDDVVLGKGESWISVTSPTEGTTHVTVWAPKEGNWQARRQSAKIYWIDACWKFPAPAIVKTGERALLMTRLTRSNGAPVVGWTVRYDILDGGPAAEFGEGKKSIEVPTGGDGTASVEVLPREMVPGVAAVRIQIVRPQTAKGDTPQMVVGQGRTSVAWSAPGLQLVVSGPETVPVDGTLSYRVDVTNTGDQPAKGVTLRYEPPAGVALLNSTPEGSPLGQIYKWNLGDIPARAAAVVEVNCRPSRAADIRSTFTAQSADGLLAENSLSTRVIGSALAVEMKPNLPTVDVGQTMQFQITIRNTGRTPLTGIRLTDTFDPGLSYVGESGGAEAGPIQRTLAEPLEAGQSRKIAATFRVDQPGKLCNRLDVAADGGHSAATRACVTGAGRAAATVPIAALDVQIEGPARVEQGQTGVFSVIVTNKSDVSARNIVVVLNHGPNFRVESGDMLVKENTAEFRIRELGAGKSEAREISLAALQAANAVTLQTTTRADNLPALLSRMDTRIDLPGAAPNRPNTPNTPKIPSVPRRGGANPPARPASDNAGNLKVELIKLNDGAAVGEEVSFQIDISNGDAQPDSELLVTVTIPPGLEKPKLLEETGAIKAAITTRGYEIGPIRTVRASETLPRMELKLTAKQLGKYKLKVQVKSERNPQGILAESGELEVHP